MDFPNHLFSFLYLFFLVIFWDRDGFILCLSSLPSKCVKVFWLRTETKRLALISCWRIRRLSGPLVLSLCISLVFLHIFNLFFLFVDDDNLPSFSSLLLLFFKIYFFRFFFLCNFFFFDTLFVGIGLFCVFIPHVIGWQYPWSFFHWGWARAYFFSHCNFLFGQRRCEILFVENWTYSGWTLLIYLLYIFLVVLIVVNERGAPWYTIFYSWKVIITPFTFPFFSCIVFHDCNFETIQIFFFFNAFSSLQF